MSESEQEKHIAALDEHTRAATQPLLKGGEMIVAWVVVAGTRKAEGGGSTITISDGLPEWQARGLLGSAIEMLDALPSDSDFFDDEEGV